jgi:hypothetical protein
LGCLGRARRPLVSDAHYAEGLVNPKVCSQKRLLILDTPEHVDSENIKFKIGHRSSAFSKRDLNFKKVAKIG